METKTRSQLFPDKEYDTLLDELEEGDYELKSELYKVTVFNKVIHISPGNVIKDERLATLYYCYVYVIIKDRVKAKLGVYEKIIEGADIPEQFDLSEFDEGSMLVFDDYYKDPKRLDEFEIVEQADTVEDNVFLYLQGLKDENPKFEISVENNKLHSETRLTKIYDMIRKDKNAKKYNDMFKVYLEYFNNLEKFNNKLMEKLEKSDLNSTNLMFILSILEFYFSVKFIFVSDVEGTLLLVDDSEIRSVFNRKTFEEIIVLDVTTKNIVEKTDDISQLKSLMDKYRAPLQVKAKASSKTKSKFETKEEAEEEAVVVQVKGKKKPREELEEGEISDEDEEEVEVSSKSKAKVKDKTLLAESKSSEFDTNIRTGLAEPSEKSSKISFKGSELKPKTKPLSGIGESVKGESATPLKTSSFLTGTTHKPKGTKLSGITEESSADISVEPVKVKSASAKPKTAPVEKASSTKASSSKSTPVEEGTKEKKKSSKSKPVEPVEPVEPVDEEPTVKPKKSSKSKTKEAEAVETRTLTPNEEAYKIQVEQMASMFKKGKSGKSKSGKNE
jgi:hypothetical protein